VCFKVLVLERLSKQKEIDKINIWMIEKSSLYLLLENPIR
jgi:hypothetical protein